MAYTAEALLGTSAISPDFLQWAKELESAEQSVELGAVRAVPALEVDAELRYRAAEFIGQVASSATIEQESREALPTMSLLEALKLAREGDMEARRLVEMNVRTDVIERTIKAGHVGKKVRQTVNGHGQVVQHGQTAEEIQANSLRYAAGSWQMRQRIEAETRNMFRIEALHRQGLLHDHVFVVISRAADDMTLEQSERAGFFTRTMSCAIQVTTAEGRELTTEPAFVAGRARPDAERHDAVTIARMGERLDINLAAKTAAQLIDTPLLIPKWMMPNGAVDVVRWFDEAAGGTFFGEAKPRQNYAAFLRQCQRREAELEPTVQAIVHELIAAATGLRTPVEATDRLGKLSGAYLLERAVVDERIDGLVFGVESAAYLEAARRAAALGDLQQANAFLVRAVRADTSSSCPGAGKGERSEADDEQAEGSDSEGDGDCDFISKKCPLCGTKNVRTLIRKLSTGQKHISGSCGCSKIA